MAKIVDMAGFVRQSGPHERIETTSSYLRYAPFGAFAACRDGPVYGYAAHPGGAQHIGKGGFGVSTCFFRSAGDVFDTGWEKMTKTCKVCGKPVPDDKPWRITCSRECDQINRSQQAAAQSHDLRRRPVKPCEFCGKLFRPANATGRFCTMSCASLWNARHKGQASKPTVCVVCGAQITSQTRRVTCGEGCFRALLSSNASHPHTEDRKRHDPKSVVNKYGELWPITRLDTPWPLPVDPQICPFGWQEVAA